MNTKEYGYRELIYDECFSSGKEFTREQLMEIVNKRLEQRDFKPIQSRTTFMQDMQEMNEKLYRLYHKEAIVWEDRHKKRYYRYADGIDGIFNRELTQEEVDNLNEVRDLLQGFKGMPKFDWIDQMLTRLDCNMTARKEIASFEGGTIRSSKFLMPLFKAISERQVLDVKYFNFFEDSEDLILHPYYLKQYWRRWYLMARREGEKEVEPFALDCIVEIQENKKVKYKGTKTSFKKYFKHLVGVTMPPETNVEHIELQVDASLVPHLLAMPIHESQTIRINEDGKSAIATLDVMINYELVQELMFYADRLVVKSPAYFRDTMKERLEWCMNSYKNVEEGRSWTADVEPQLFAFNYIHEDEHDWIDIHYRISIGLHVLDSYISEWSNDWKYIRVCLERIIDHSRTVIELNNEDEPTKIELKKDGDMLDVLVTPDSFTSKDQMPISGWVSMKDAVRELYNGLMECAKAFPKEYDDGNIFTYDVVYQGLKSEKIENYLKEE